MPNSWKKNALIIGDPLQMSHQEYNEKKQKLLKWKCHQDWRKNKEVAKKIKKLTLYDMESPIPLSMNVIGGKGYSPVTDGGGKWLYESIYDDQKYAWKKSPPSFTTASFSQYHKNRKDEKESDFQWENFPGLLQEFKQGQFYTGTINSKGKKNIQKHSGSTMKYSNPRCHKSCHLCYPHHKQSRTHRKKLTCSCDRECK